jgi:ABC-type amino acid transport substrate-binding protein
MHLTVFSILTAAAERGWTRLRPVRFARWLAISTGVGVLVLAANHFVVKQSVAGEPPPRNRVVAMELYNTLVDVAEAAAGPNPAPRREGEGLFERIRRTGELRVGYVPKNPPFSYRNRNERLVGFDIDVVQRLAWELGVTLTLVPYEQERLDDALRNDHFDLAAGGIASSPRNFGQFRESHPYMDLHAALLVEDRRVRDFQSRATMLKLDRLQIGYVAGGLKIRTGLQEEDLFDYVEVPSAKAFLAGEVPEVDALLTTAESGAIYSMLAPRFSVVIPTGLTPVTVPVVFGLQEDPAFADYLDRWIRIKREDGTGVALYEHWILGKEDKKKSHRWSVIQDALEWVD